MRLEDITNVLCLSCLLMFFYVSSLPSCNTGWFGHQCKYKCRCQNTTCDVNGSCIRPHACLRGWFGPACQYADLAYSRANVTALTDGNESTCNIPNAGDRITITLRESSVFTWLRIHVRDQGSDALRSLSVTFLSNTSSVPCPVWRKHAVNKTILDMHCNLSQTVNAITLTGQAVPNLCSVYVSGGRNVAVKEMASQDSTLELFSGGTNHRLDACRAVDGDTRAFIHYLSCTHTNHTSSWTLTLSRPRSVHRYAIYNRDSLQSRLIGFQLNSFNSMNRSVFVYKDRETSSAMVYRFLHSPLLVQMVVVTANNSDNMTTLCEVEIYGDSVCDAQHYGRDCEHSCKCLNNEACFVSTGACPSGCPAGFFGESCVGECSPNCAPSGEADVPSCNNNTGACLKGCQSGSSGALCRDECELETYGINCNESCSPNCAPFGQANVSSCNNKTGACLKGCQSGSAGALCRDECELETFGINCNESCSPNCAPSGQAGMSSCDNKTGVCLKGCQRGSSGALCQDECELETFGINCNESCSPYCAPFGQANVSSCDNKTGTCLKGCQSGSSGALCQDECELETFGINCNESCNSTCAPSGQANVSSCDNKTGACLTGCQSGLSGALCRDECKPQTFGINCNESCSPKCAASSKTDESTCDTKTGACTEGCQSGFSGPLCQDECKPQTFGKNCNESCSPKCAASSQTDVSSCDTKTGACTKGCQSGFSGPLCQDVAPSVAVAPESEGLPMDIILGLIGFIAALFVLAVCFRRKEKPRHAAERDALNAQYE